jgi:glycine cleavage system transcriptional repressor
MTTAVISTIGRDRPGIVDQLAEQVAALGLNIEDSRMAVLGGEFAVLMSVTGDDAALGELEKKLEQMARAADFAFLFRRSAERTLAPSMLYHARVVAMDHPGIVHGVAGFFSRRSINIRDLETDTVAAPHTGTPIFNLVMTVEVPAGTKVRELRTAFETFCDEHNLDGELESS